MTDKTDREIMYQAMVALDSKHDMTKAEWRYLQYHAFNDLRERLAQPEQWGIDVLGGDWNKFARAAVAILKETK